MTSLNLRVKGPNGQTKTITGENNETFDSFLKRMCTVFRSSSLIVLCGYPPKPVFVDKSAVISDILKSGDSIILREEAINHSAPSNTTGLTNENVSSTSGTSNSLPVQKNDAKWICKTCTFENEMRISSQLCEMCCTPNTTTAGGNVGNIISDVVAKKHNIPDDNSCLFHAIIFLLNCRESVQTMREAIANAVKQNPNRWNGAVLGKSNDEYASFILDSNKWGGQIELNILCSIVKVEIASIDIESGRIDIYGQDADYTERVYMLFSGIHFDAIVFTELSSSIEKKRVLKEDTVALKAAEDLASQLRKGGAFVNQQTMHLVCATCGFEMNGDYEARCHAGSSGHTDFRMK